MLYEKVFDNVFDAMNFLMRLEQIFYEKDFQRQQAIRDVKGRVIFDLDFPLSGYFNDAKEDEFILSRLRSQRYVLKPNLRGRKLLYRGQRAFYDECKPSLFRVKGKDYFLDDCIKSQELLLLLLSHPLVQLLDLGVDVGSGNMRFEMNLYGLAQHYYCATSLLDLTLDPNVAIFFATTNYDKDTDTYSPVIDESKEGVLYAFELTDIKKDFKNNGLRSIGQQIFPRSGYQKGFLYEFEKEDNFNNFSNVHIIRFKHKAEVSQKIYDYHLGGKRLFPDDILSKHWKEYNKDKKVVSTRALDLNARENSSTPKMQLRSELNDLGFMVKDYKPMFTPDELLEYYQDIKNGFWEEWVNKIYLSQELRERLLNVEKNPDYYWAFKPGIKFNIPYTKGYLLNYYKQLLMY